MAAQNDRGADAPSIAVRRVAPLPAMQRMAAAHLSRSHLDTAPVTLLGEVEADALMALRERLNAGRTKAGRCSVTHLVLKAVAQALVAHPALNTGLIDGQLHEWSEINIGVALALPDGNLIVPVIRQADTKPLAQIATELADFKARGRTGKLQLADVRGGTFTLTNAGMIPSARWTTPIIHLPQCAILGLGAIRPAPVVRDGAVAVGHVLPTSLTFDHRLVNGYPASAFIDTLHGLIMAPERIDLGV